MQLKKPQREHSLFSTLNKLRQSRARIVVILLVYTALIFSMGYLVHISGFSFGQEAKPIYAMVVLMPKRLQAIFSNPEIEQVSIDIKHDDFMRLAYQREIALNRGILISEDNEYVPATITHDGKSYDVSMRLKGDWLEHIRGDKWSYRIRVKGDDTLFGMKQFSIQHPQTRKYINEWIFHKALRREGLISLRYKFIDVTLNGENLGIYALEEHFEKRLVEHNQRREGPIVRFNENVVWEEKLQQWFPFPDAEPNGNSHFLSVDVDTFQTNQMLIDPDQHDRHLQAIYLLEAFRRGEMKTSDVFDINKLAIFFALSDLLGAQHGIFWGNLRYYYNPVTDRLEPIGFDSGAGWSIPGLSVRRADELGPELIETLFSDPEFFEEYMRVLERVAEPAYLDDLFAELDDELQLNLNIIYTEYPDFDYSVEVFYQNQQYVNTVLNPIKGLHAYFHQSTGDLIDLELGNIQSMPVEVLNVSYADNVILEPISEIVLPISPVVESKPVDYQVHHFRPTDGSSWSDDMLTEMMVNYRLVGTSKIRQVPIFPWSYLDDDFLGDRSIVQDPNIDQFDFLEIDESRREIIIKQGDWVVEENLVVPDGYRLLGGAGTQLDLVNSAMIISNSPVELVGNEEQAFVIRSSDSTGQGLFILNAEKTSIFDHATFENLGNPSQGGWELSGAVTSYESPVQITYSHFLGNRSEDALNVIRSNFSIDRSVFEHSPFDALDADFSEGSITRSSFVDIGNDAIDVSGSLVDLNRIFINGTGDKGLSVGEDSQVTADNVEIEGAEIAVASKDLSDLVIRNLRINNGKIGLTAFQKKPEFGPATLRVDDLVITDVDIPFLVEEDSNVQVDGQMIEATERNVQEIFDATEYDKPND